MKKAIVFLLCLITLMSVLSFSASAEDGAPDDWVLKTEDLPQEDQDRYLKNIRWTTSDNTQPLGLIHCYAAASDGSVAIGLNEGDPLNVYVFDAQGEHLYTVRFAPSSAYALGWRQADHTLLIYIYRSERLVAVGADRSVKVYKCPGTTDNERQIRTQFSREQRVGNCGYRLENPYGLFNFLLAPDYSRLVATEGNETRILYEAEHSRVQDKLMYSIGIVVVWIVAAVWVSIVIRRIVKSKKQSS